MEAADTLEPVLDLAAPLALDDRDEVEDASRGERLVLRMTLDEQVAQRRVDLGGRRVARAPHRVGAGHPSCGGYGHSWRQCWPGSSSWPASVGPCEPAG